MSRFTLICEPKHSVITNKERLWTYINKTSQHYGVRKDTTTICWNCSSTRYCTVCRSMVRYSKKHCRLQNKEGEGEQLTVKQYVLCFCLPVVEKKIQLKQSLLSGQVCTVKGTLQN